VDRAFLLDDPADVAALLGVLDRRGALVALDQVEALDVDAALLGLGAGDLPGLALVLAGLDHHGVVLADAHTHGVTAPPVRAR
jgi:hypothetical protein